MAKSKVPITYAFGRRDRTDPKLAPFGVLKVGKNLRVRKDGRLGVRHGYQPLAMTTRNGTLVAYDLFEFQGRLCALGNDASDGYPTDTFEYLGLSSERWRGTDTSQRVTLNPFTNMREVAGVPQPDGGVSLLDGACGGGYVCLAYLTAGSEACFAVVVDQATDQVVLYQSLVSIFAVPTKLRVAFAGGTFYVLGARNANNALTLAHFTPGTHTAFASLATVDGASATAISALDMAAVTNATDARVVIAYDRGSAASLAVKVYDAAGSQVGTTCTVASTDTLNLAVEADQADDTINLLTFVGASTATLRTFDFDGNLLDDTASISSGTNGSLCRIPEQGATGEHVAVVIQRTTTTIRVNYVDIDTHGLTDTQDVDNALIRTRPISGQTAGQPLAIAFGAITGPALTAIEDTSSILVFLAGLSTATIDTAHMVLRDPLRALDSQITNLSRDTATGKVCWVTARDPGVSSLGVPVVSLLDFQSTARRQMAIFGGLAYFTGATPHVYDGRLNYEIGFSEVPGVVSLTASNGSGSLTNSATYSYVVVWECTASDGSVIMSAPSLPESVTLGASDDTVEIVATAPHTFRLALGTSYGTDTTLVVYRTVWDSVSGTQGSTFRRCKSVRIGAGISSYGSNVELTGSGADTMSDADLADEEPLYTQAERGPLSGPLQHDGPRGCSYITSTEARLILGGLSQPYQVQVSKAAFLGESFTFSNFSNFFTQVSGAVLGVHRLDQARLVFTARGLFALSGEGPDDLGGGGLGDPVELATPSGLQDWRSLLEDPTGLWFQLDDAKLFKIPRGGGSPTWEGVDIEDTLLAFPVITGAGKSRRDNAAVFACENTGSTSARIIVNDFRTSNWFEDTPVLQTNQGIEALCSFGDSIAYVSGGVVYVQSTSSFADGSSTFIEHQWRTHPLYPFGLGGYGEIYELLATGEYRGDCVLTLRYSFDDGVTFATHPATFTLSSLTVGQTIQRKWTLPQDIASSLVIEITATAVVATATEGFILNQVDLLVEAEDGLRELSADEMG